MGRRRHELTDFEWSIIAPLLPRKSRGDPRVDDRWVLNGILWRFRTGSPWADIPERYGPHTTCYNRFVRWRKAGVWDHLLSEISKGYDGDTRTTRQNQRLGQNNLPRKTGRRPSIQQVAPQVP